MSYARFKEGVSDVYMYHHYMGFIECCGCWISDEVPDEYGEIPSPRFETPRRAIMHLMDHVSRGYKVPEDTFDRIYEEYANNMDEPVQPHLATPEQEARQKARLERLRQEWKRQLDEDQVLDVIEELLRKRVKHEER